MTPTEETLKKKVQYSINYAKKKYKRVPLDLTKDFYEKVKVAAETSGESVNGYIKKAIQMRIDND